ncbi:MAG TPA: PAS domain S-box protein [Candidatus Acidoferrales bacterium]|nr:PAS domain S-box protein [Candidatus Acidoferrales bacterium]
MSTDLSHRDPSQSVSTTASDSQVEKLTEAIVRSQHNYRELIDHLDQALFTLSLEGEVRVANLRLSEILGISFQELIGRSLSDFIESPALEEAQRWLPALREAGTWSGTIPVWLKKDKTLRYFDCWLQTAVDGEVRSIIGWARDVTKQQESEIRFRELFETFSEGILFVTPGGQLLDANPALVRILGYSSKEELQAVNFRDVYVDPSARDAIIRELETKGAVHEREIVMRRKDGRQIHCLTSGFAMRDASGRPVRLQGTLIDITERREMEKRLQQEQSFTRRMVASFPDLIAVLDRDGRFIYISDHVEKVLGWQPTTYVGRIFGTRANPEDKANLHSMFQRVVRGEESQGQVEFRSPHADGSFRDLLLTARPFFDEDGRVGGLVTSARDITERKKMEEALRESEERVRLMVEGVTDYAIFLLDPDGHVASWNRGAERIKGYQGNEIIGKHFSVFYPPEDLASGKTDRELKGAAEQGQCEDEGWRLRKDGSRFRANVVITALRDREGKLRGFSNITRDVTQHYEMQRKLQQEQEFVRSLVECFPDLIVVLDIEGRFKFVSDRVNDILGVTPEEYVGKPIGQRIGPEDRSKLTQMFKNAVSGHKGQEQIEIRAQHANGNWKILRVIANPLFDDKGKIVGMVSSGRDVTESKQLEQQLADKEKFAAMGQMMAGAAHELNNPLTAILGVSDLLRERAAEDATRRQVDLVLQQARRAAAIVQNLLAFSRPLAPGRATLRLGEILNEALELERANLEKKNIHVKFTTPDDLPTVDGDRKLLLQVFLNILSNAEQSISPAHEQGQLDISVTRAGDKIRVAFADDGPGIPADIVGKVFDPFFTTKRPGGGSGLGLTISLAVVKEHGGNIEIESNAGAGAVIHVVLPVGAEIRPSTAAPAKSAPALPGSTALRDHSVLIVDDEESIREIVQEGLSSRGMKVQAVGTSEAALDYLAKNTCEIVLCDFNLPGMSGDKMFEELRARLASSLPRFVFMTGELVSPTVRARYREKGARVLQKPFQISALAALLTELLQPQPAPAK